MRYGNPVLHGKKLGHRGKGGRGGSRLLCLFVKSFLCGFSAKTTQEHLFTSHRSASEVWVDSDKLENFSRNGNYVVVARSHSIYDWALIFHPTVHNMYLFSGCALPPEKEKREHFDSNCITPVSTKFLIKILHCTSKWLRCFSENISLQVQYVILIKQQVCPHHFCWLLSVEHDLGNTVQMQAFQMHIQLLGVWNKMFSNICDVSSALLTNLSVLSAGNWVYGKPISVPAVLYRRPVEPWPRLEKHQGDTLWCQCAWRRRTQNHGLHSQAKRWVTCFCWR